MLTSLHIENIAVIKKADIDLNSGFTVLTGETGAGKSIIIDSINLLMGARPSKELIRNGANSAMVSAVFTDISGFAHEQMSELGIEPDEDNSLMIQRRITQDGKAISKLNGRSMSVAMQKDLGRLLINIHGQHDNQALLQPSTHILFLDSYADLSETLVKYEKNYDLMRECINKIKELTKNDQEKARLIELLKYQILDIDSVKLKDNDEENKLITQRKKIQNTEKIAKYTKMIYHSLYRNEKGASAYDLLGKAADALEQLVEVMPEALSLVEKLNSYKYEIEDIAESAKDVGEEDFDDPTAELNRIELRLDSINKLKRKYGSSIAEILEYRIKSAAELDDMELSDEKLSKLWSELNVYTGRAKDYAEQLTKLRHEAAAVLEEKIMEELAFLEMAKVRFSVQFRHFVESDGCERYSRRGIDDIEFMISTNLGEPLKPLGKIASGGELSRIMLAVKCVFAGKENTETLIFDEVDTGVSGKTSEKIGIKLLQISGSCQVICVTHSAQIAALADNHLYISKSEVDGRIETNVCELDYEERVGEVARIMGGSEITSALLESARELIESKLHKQYY